MDSNSIRFYVLAAQSIFGIKKAEKWLDETSDKLIRSVKDEEEAKSAIYRLLEGSE